MGILDELFDRADNRGGLRADLLIGEDGAEQYAKQKNQDKPFRGGRDKGARMKKWDESQHPRHPAGNEHGGEFAGGQEAAAAPAPTYTPRPLSDDELAALGMAPATPQADVPDAGIWGEGLLKRSRGGGGLADMPPPVEPSAEDEGGGFPWESEGDLEQPAEGEWGELEGLDAPPEPSSADRIARTLKLMPPGQQWSGWTKGNDGMMHRMRGGESQRSLAPEQLASLVADRLAGTSPVAKNPYADIGQKIAASQQQEAESQQRQAAEQAQQAADRAAAQVAQRDQRRAAAKAQQDAAAAAEAKRQADLAAQAGQADQRDAAEHAANQAAVGMGFVDRHEMQAAAQHAGFPASTAEEAAQSLQAAADAADSLVQTAEAYGYQRGGGDAYAESQAAAQHLLRAAGQSPYGKAPDIEAALRTLQSRPPQRQPAQGGSPAGIDVQGLISSLLGSEHAVGVIAFVAAFWLARQFTKGRK